MAYDLTTEEGRRKNAGAQARWRDRNTEKARKTRRDRKRDIAKWFQELKAGLSCCRCGEGHPACLEFHHRDPKQKDLEVANMVKDGWGKQRILEEIEKCDSVCANCHRKIHFEMKLQDGKTHAVVS